MMKRWIPLLCLGALLLLLRYLPMPVRHRTIECFTAARML